MTKPLLSLALLLLLAPSAAADGLPLPVDASAGGVLSADERTRYLTAELGRDRTVLLAQAQRYDTGGMVLGTQLLDGRWTVPLVAYDGTADGLSKNGRTLVLIRPRVTFPRKSTSFAVFAIDSRKPGHMRRRDVIRLRGDFSFDALSPDGRSLFLIEYVSRRDPAKYRVRVIDLRRGRLAPKPISDSHRLATRMNGYPYARTTSPGGRWVYTLYSAPSDGHAFVHALDTRTRSAMCIDLDLHPYEVETQMPELSFDPAGRTVRVIDGAVRASIDARTYAVEYPPAARRPAAPLPERDDDGGGPPWQALAGGAAVLAATAFALRGRRRRRRRELDAWLGAELGDLGPGAAVEERERRGEGAGAL